MFDGPRVFSLNQKGHDNQLALTRARSATIAFSALCLFALAAWVAFVSSGWHKADLTIMAIAVRACDNLIEKFKRGEHTITD